MKIAKLWTVKGAIGLAAGVLVVIAVMWAAGVSFFSGGGEAPSPSPAETAAVSEFVETVKPDAMGQTAESRSISFAADGQAEETRYMLEDRSTGIVEDSHRFADHNAYWIYDFKFPAAVSDVALDLDLAGQYRIEGSTDGDSWFELTSTKDTNKINVHIAAAEKLSEPLDELYVKFSDNDPSDGFGPSLFQLTLSYTPSNSDADMGPVGPPNPDIVDHTAASVDDAGSAGTAPSAPDGMASHYDNTFAFATNGSDDELAYLYQDHSTGIAGGDHRFADRTDYWIYSFRFSDQVRAAALDLDIGGQYFVQASRDGVNWTVLKKAKESPGRAVVRLDLNGALRGGDTLYIKLSDRDIADGFGVSLWHATIGYTLDNAKHETRPGGNAASTSTASTGTAAAADNELNFLADGGAAESKYLYEDGDSGIFEGEHRFADQDAYWIYGMQFPSSVANAKLNLEIGGQYLVEASTDGVKWTGVGRSAEASGKAELSADLTSLLGAGTRTLYLRFSDNDKKDGFGAALWRFGMTYSMADGTKNVQPAPADRRAAAVNDVGFRADGGAAEGIYLYENHNTGLFDDGHRFADNDAYWVYGFQFPVALKSAAVHIDIGGQYVVEGSTDGVRWNELLTAEGAPGREGIDADLTPLLKGGAQKLYIRFSDRDKADGFGAALWSFGMSYTLVDGSELAKPDAIGQTAPEIDDEVNQFGFSANGGAEELNYMLEDHNTGIYEGEHRFADQEAYWTYYLKFSDTIENAAVELDMGGQYSVWGSYNGTDWVSLADSAEAASRAMVKVEVGDLLRGHDKLYLKLADRNPADGFGPALWGISLQYSMKGGKKESRPEGPASLTGSGGGTPIIDSSGGSTGGATTNRFTFNADGGAGELAYLYDDHSSGIFGGDHRFADNDAYWIYGFSFADGLKSAKLKAQLGGQYVVEGSTDGTTWTMVETSTDTPGQEMRTYDLAGLLGASPTKLYLRFSDRDPSDGFGPGLWSLSMDYTLAGGQADSGPAGIPSDGSSSGGDPSGGDPTGGDPTANTFGFSADGGAGELAYLYDDHSSGIFGGDHRYADNDAYWIYGFAFADGLKSAKLNMQLGGQYVVEGSTDGTTWTMVETSTDTPGQEMRTYDLAGLLGASPTKLYLRFSDRDPSDGFGPGLWSLSMDYTLAGGQADSGPAGIPSDGSSSGGDPSGGDPTGGDPTANTFGFSADGGAGELAYLYDDHSSGIFGGDHRFADNDAYWIYGFAFADGLKSAKLNMQLGGQYVVEGSTDGTTWTMVETSTDTPGQEMRTYDLAGLLGASPTKLYLRFSDRDPSDGFGPGLWSLSMDYTLAGGQADSGPAGIPSDGSSSGGDPSGGDPTGGDPTANTFGFSADGGAGELAYLYDDHSSGIFGGDHRFADNDAYWIYGFAFADGLKSAKLNMQLGGQYVVEGSTDGTTWTMVETSTDTPGQEMRTYDLAGLLGASPTKLYLRFSDRDPSDGFGPGLWSLSMDYTLAGGQADEGPIGIGSVSFIDRHDGPTGGAGAGQHEPAADARTHPAAAGASPAARVVLLLTTAWLLGIRLPRRSGGACGKQARMERSA